MAKEPENLTLRLLREIRARQDEHGEILERVDDELRDMRPSMIYTPGRGGTPADKLTECGQTGS